MITQEELKSQLTYDPETGLFSWKRPLDFHHRAVAGGYKEGYILIRVFGGRYSAHRLAWLYMTGKFPIHQIDHIDGDKSNNKFSNLRDVSTRTNQAAGKRKSRWGTGVSYRSFDKFVARIKLDGRTIYIGSYLTKQEASDAYNKTLKDHLDATRTKSEITKLD
jgi:hypothetical protein